MQPMQDISSTQQGQAKNKASEAQVQDPRPMHHFTAPAKRIEECLELLGVLSRVLEHNGGYKGGDVGEHPAMIGEYGEDGIVRAMKIIADAGHREFCRMATDLEIPQ